jgi:hypothetical protein
MNRTDCHFGLQHTPAQEYAAYAPFAERVLRIYPSLEDEVKFMSLSALAQLLAGRPPGDWLIGEQSSSHARRRGLA